LGNPLVRIIFLAPGIIFACVFIYLSIKIMYKVVKLMTAKKIFINKEKFWLNHGLYFIIAGIVFLIVWEVVYQVVKVFLLSDKVVAPFLLITGGMNLGIGLILEFIVGGVILATQIPLNISLTKIKSKPKTKKEKAMKTSPKTEKDKFIKAISKTENDGAIKADKESKIGEMKSE